MPNPRLRGPPFGNTRRDLIDGTIDSLIHAFVLAIFINFKIGLPFETTRRDLIDGTIDSLINKVVKS